jgi:hypothetical protein
VTFGIGLAATELCQYDWSTKTVPKLPTIKQNKHVLLYNSLPHERTTLTRTGSGTGEAMFCHRYHKYI